MVIACNNGVASSLELSGLFKTTADKIKDFGGTIISNSMGNTDSKINPPHKTIKSYARHSPSGIF